MASKTLPKISIITTVRNAEKTIEKAITSLVKQNYPNLEYLIYDGDSSDNTLEIIKKYKEHIAHYESKKDNGPVYNHGINKASGDIIAFLNADDWYEDDILHDIATLYNKHKKAEIFTCGFRLVDDKNNLIFSTKNSDLEPNLNNLLKVGPLVNARFYKPSIFKKYGLFKHFDESGNYLETSDKGLFFKIVLSKTPPININLNKTGYTSLKHSQSRTYNNNLKIKHRLYLQHLNLVEEQFTQNLSSDQKKSLNNWYSQEVAKLLLVKLLLLNFESYKKILRSAYNRLGTFFVPKIGIALINFAYRKIIRRSN